MIVADDDQEPLWEQQQHQHHAKDEHNELDVSISIITAFDDANATGKRAQVIFIKNISRYTLFPRYIISVFFFYRLPVLPCFRKTIMLANVCLFVHSLVLLFFVR